MSQAEQPPYPRPSKMRRWELPPLILHPFSDKRGPETLLDCSRAQLMLAGVLPMDGMERETLERRVVEGRVCEVKMLYYVGLDLIRWLEQCLEVAAREQTLDGTGLSMRSFAGLLVAEPPDHIREKLQGWGVADFKTLFSRALGLNAVFACAPGEDIAQASFLLDYHRYADVFFRCWSESQEGRTATPGDFTFDLYASGEYSRILEREWGTDSGGGVEPS